VPKKVEQINDHLFIDTYKSDNIKNQPAVTSFSEYRRSDCQMSDGHRIVLEVLVLLH